MQYGRLVFGTTGTEDTGSILREIEGHIKDSEAYGKWLEDTLVQAAKQLEKRRNGNISEARLQENYGDNQAKTMSNVIWKEEKPECFIEMTRDKQ